MGSEWSCVLPKLGATLVTELATDIVAPAITLAELRELATSFARDVSAKGEADLDGVLSKSFLISISTTLTNEFTKRAFLSWCGIVFETISGKVSALTCKALATKLKAALIRVFHDISNKAVSPFIRAIFRRIVGETPTTSSKTAQACRSAAGTLSGEALENATRCTRACTSVKTALKWGVVVDGAVAGGTIAYAAYRYKQSKIDGKEFKRIAIRRSSGAVGSVGVGAAGTFIGTLLFPGVGTLVGGFIGGMAGDYMGSWAGGKLDDCT